MALASRRTSRDELSGSSLRLPMLDFAARGAARPSHKPVSVSTPPGEVKALNPQCLTMPEDP